MQLYSPFSNQILCSSRSSQFCCVAKWNVGIIMRQTFRNSLKSPRHHLHKETSFCSIIMPKDFLSFFSSAQKNQISSCRLLCWSWRCGKWSIFHQATMGDVPSPPQFLHRKPAVKLEFFTWRSSELCSLGQLYPEPWLSCTTTTTRCPWAETSLGPLWRVAWSQRLQLQLNMTDPHCDGPWDTHNCQTHHLSPKQNASDLQAELPSPSRLIHYKIAVPSLMVCN